MQIEIKNIAKKFKRHHVLRDINLAVDSGRCIGILGANGSGKSTLLSILAGIQNCDHGSFLCDGEDLLRSSKKRSQVVGYVPQGTPLIEELSAKDNLLLWYSRDEMKKELEAGVLALLGIGDFLNVPVSKMSGGMKKRLSIGCAVAAHPPVLLLDEPTAALDLVCKQTIVEYLEKYKKAGGAILLATHDVAELALCDRWFIIKNGVAQPFEYKGDLKELTEKL